MQDRNATRREHEPNLVSISLTVYLTERLLSLFKCFDKQEGGICFSAGSLRPYYLPIYLISPSPFIFLLNSYIMRHIKGVITSSTHTRRQECDQNIKELDNSSFSGTARQLEEQGIAISLLSTSAESSLCNPATSNPDTESLVKVLSEVLSSFLSKIK